MPIKKIRPAQARLLLVDDHPLLREGVATRLALESDLLICGQAGDGVQAMDAAGRTRPDLMIVDISLPGRNGIDLIKDLRARHPHLQILVFSMHDESVYAERALHAGARGYVMKTSPPEYLIRAIHRVLDGEIVLGNDLAERMPDRVAGGHTAGPGSPLEALTERELEIFRLIGKGRPRGWIATELHLSVKTVETHRANIRQKLGLHDAVELQQHAVQFVQREGATPPS